MSERNYKIKKYYRFNSPFYRIEVDGFCILDLSDDNMKLAKKIKRFLEEECQDIEYWFESFKEQEESMRLQKD